jgi:hypothetical protein
MTTVLPVIFRKHFERGSGWGVTAFFPTEPSDYSGRTVTCYQHVGQHGGASFDYMHSGKLAKPEEYNDLLVELQQIYAPEYELKVYKRAQPAHRKAFDTELRRIGGYK